MDGQNDSPLTRHKFLDIKLIKARKYLHTYHMRLTTRTSSCVHTEDRARNSLCSVIVFLKWAFACPSSLLILLLLLLLLLPLLLLHLLLTHRFLSQEGEISKRPWGKLFLSFIFFAFLLFSFPFFSFLSLLFFSFPLCH